MTSFELFGGGKGLIITEATNATTRQRRRAMLLHFAGPDVQEIYSTLADTGEGTDYAAAITALNGYFLPKVNAAFARQKFHRLQQKEGETVLQFVTRLRKEGKDCNFGVDFDNQMRDAVLCKCRSDYVRRKLLEEREKLTLARTLEIAEQCESVDHQMSHLSVSETSKEDANRVYEKPERPDGKQNRKKNGVHCYRCGSSGHLVWACERYHAYIYGMRFDLVTNHKPLEVIYGPRSKPCARIERWVIRLQTYDFRVVYAPGQSNVADPLSRLVRGNKAADHQHGAEEYVRFAAISATPAALTTREVEEASAVDDELKALREEIKTGQFEKCKGYAPAAEELGVIGQLVLRGTRIVLPSKLRSQAISLAHEGHLGIVGTKRSLRNKVWWPGIDKAAEKFCRSCYGCQLVARPNPPEPLTSTTLPEGPWQELAVDLLGPLPSGHSILVVVDNYSRYYEYAIMKSTTTVKVIDNLEESFSRHGLPIAIKADNGPQFISGEFQEYCVQNGIVHLKTTPKWPQAKGEVKRQNASLMKIIRIAQAEGVD